ncbi:MAG: hypothetical protein ABH896_00570 [Candidatus Jacksonbacteria bacterium]
MRKIVKLLLILFIIIILHYFVSSLLSPLNFLEIINIALMLFFLFWGIDKSIKIALILGIAKDYGQTINIGVSSIIYLSALIIVCIMRNTVLTHQNRAAVFLLSLFFNSIYFIGFILSKFNLNIMIIQEAAIALLVNTIFTFLIFIFIQWFQSQFRKRFI